MSSTERVADINISKVGDLFCKVVFSFTQLRIFLCSLVLNCLSLIKTQVFQQKNITSLKSCRFRFNIRTYAVIGENDIFAQKLRETFCNRSQRKLIFALSFGSAEMTHENK